MIHETGSLSSYFRNGCRCVTCKKVANDYVKARRSSETAEQRRVRLDRKNELQRARYERMTMEQRRKRWGGKSSAVKNKPRRVDDGIFARCELSLSGWHVWSFNAGELACSKCNALQAVSA